MSESKPNSHLPPAASEAPGRKKSSLFEVLNRPIHLPFRRGRTEAPAEPIMPF